MAAKCRPLNTHNLHIFQPILMILVSKFMVHRALSNKTYLSLGLLSPLRLKLYKVHLCVTDRQDKWMNKPKAISNSYSMGCPPVCGDNPQALASGLSYVQVDKHGRTILYHLHQYRPCKSLIFCAKIGKGGTTIYAHTTFQKRWHGRRLLFTQIFFA